jgi:hypothetical protein
VKLLKVRVKVVNLLLNRFEYLMAFQHHQADQLSQDYQLGKRANPRHLKVFGAEGSRHGQRGDNPRANHHQPSAPRGALFALLHPAKTSRCYIG